MTPPPGLFTLYLIVTDHDAGGTVGLDAALAVTPQGAPPPSPSARALAEGLRPGEVAEALAWLRQALEIRAVRGWPS